MLGCAAAIAALLATQRLTRPHPLPTTVQVSGDVQQERSEVREAVDSSVLLAPPESSRRPPSPTDASPDAVGDLVRALSRDLEAGACDGSFTRRARAGWESAIELGASPRVEDLEGWLADPRTAAAAAVIGNAADLEQVPRVAVGELQALWDDPRSLSADTGIDAALAARARALAVGPTLYRYDTEAGRERLLAGLWDAAPSRRLLSRSLLSEVDAADAAGRIARLSSDVRGDDRAECLAIAARTTIERIESRAELDLLSLSILRERAEAWSARGGSLERRATALVRELDRLDVRSSEGNEALR